VRVSGGVAGGQKVVRYGDGHIDRQNLLCQPQWGSDNWWGGDTTPWPLAHNVTAWFCRQKIVSYCYYCIKFAAHDFSRNHNLPHSFSCYSTVLDDFVINCSCLVLFYDVSLFSCCCISLWYHHRFYTVLQKTLHCAASWHFILPTPMCIEYWKLPICGNDYKLCRDICHHGDGHRGDVYHHVWLTVDWVEINLHPWRTKPNMIICLKSLGGVEAVDRSELVVYASDNLMALDSHIRDKIYLTQGEPRRQPHRRSGLATLPSVGAVT